MINMTRKSGFICIFIAVMLLLFSCDRNSPYKDLQAYLAQLKSSGANAVKGDVPKVNQAVPPEEVKFDAGQRRSPFEVLEAAPSKTTAATNPLHAYPVDMLRFVGTVTQDAATMAFITAPDNRIYHIKVGDLIGEHDSKVIAIEPDHVSLEEEYIEEGSTTPMKRVVTIQLKEASQ